MTEGRKRRKIRLSFSEKAEKYVRADTSLETRLMAARAAVPLEPAELASVLFALVHDAETSVRERATQSLKELPESICRTVLESRVNPAVLAYLARVHAENEDHLERLVLNPAADDATVAYVASLPHPRLLDLIGRNQERMLRSEDIVEALGRNPLIGRATIERILGFLEGDVLRAHADAAAAPGGDSFEAEQVLATLLGKDIAHLARSLASEREDGDAGNDARDANLFAAVQTMTIVQKIKLARLGGREARALLVRDRNKVVASAVIMSPRITESEVATIAQSRNVAEEVLRRICANRDWLRSYPIKQALATNPKTPQISAIKFLSHLHERDLRSIAKSRDVTSTISAQARRVLQRRGKF